MAPDYLLPIPPVALPTRGNPGYVVGMTSTQITRRTNALSLVRRSATGQTVNDQALRNAETILRQEFGYDNAMLGAARRFARKDALALASAPIAR